MTNFIKKLVNGHSAKVQGNCCGVEIKEVTKETQEKESDSCCGTATNESSSSCCTTDTKENSSSCCG
jgi:hypothetical protein